MSGCEGVGDGVLELESWKFSLPAFSLVLTERITGYFEPV